MSVLKLSDSLGNWESAVANLERALTLSTDQELVYEGTIPRFEIVAELAWKTLKRALEFEGRSPKTPRESLREAFAIGWLGGDEAIWLDILDHRNMTSHVYLDGDLVESAYRRISEITPTVRATLDLVKARYAPMA